MDFLLHQELLRGNPSLSRYRLLFVSSKNMATWSGIVHGFSLGVAHAAAIFSAMVVDFVQDYGVGRPQPLQAAQVVDVE